MENQEQEKKRGNPIEVVMGVALILVSVIVVFFMVQEQLQIVINRY